jgi:RNA polymerase sigma-70 factor (ECF subfamily)
MTRGEEQVLIERAAAGDKAAAEGFIRAHQGSLYAYLLRISGKPEMAEDIVQEAFVRVLTNLDRFDPRFRFSTWLFTIAKRLYVIDSQRHKPAYDSDTVGAWQGSGERPEAGAISDEQGETVRDAVQAALLALPTDQREVVVLFHQLDWPIWLIAQHMDMPEGTVKSHLHRGRKKMRVLLNSHEALARRVGEVLGVRAGDAGGDR